MAAFQIEASWVAQLKIDFIIAHFTDFEQVKIDGHFAEFGQVKIDSHFANFEQLETMLLLLISLLHGEKKCKIFFIIYVSCE